MRGAKYAVAGLILLAAGGTAEAGAYTDDMNTCLAKSTAQADRVAMIQWVFGAISMHPDIRPLSNITDEQRKAFNRKAAEIIQRLMTVDCRKEIVAVIKNEGFDAVKQGFSTLGETAMSGLVDDKSVSDAMEDFAANFDQSKMTDLFKEALTDAKPAKP